MFPFILKNKLLLYQSSDVKTVKVQSKLDEENLWITKAGNHFFKVFYVFFFLAGPADPPTIMHLSEFAPMH